MKNCNKESQKEKPKELPSLLNGWVGQVRKRNVRIAAEDMAKIRTTYFVDKIEKEVPQTCGCIIS